MVMGRIIAILQTVAILFMGCGFSTALTTKQGTKPVVLEGSINLKESLVLSVMDVSDRQQVREFPVDVNGKFRAVFDSDKSRWFEVTFSPASKNRQLGATFPLLLHPGDHLHLEFDYDKDTYLTLAQPTTKSANAGLIAYAAQSNRLTRDLFYVRDQPDAYANAVQGYLDGADEVLRDYEIVDEEIVAYVKVWSTINYLAQALHSRDIQLTAQQLEAFGKVLDSEKTRTFWNGITTANSLVNRLIERPTDPLDGIVQKASRLEDLFRDTGLKQALIEADLDRYVQNYRFTSDEIFHADIQRFEALLESLQDLDIRSTALHDLKNLRYTSPKSEAPLVYFKDADGAEVRLQQFAGNYVYIDLWASWCVPCIKEIPHLQKLEAKYQDEPIVFVSISLDGDKQAWRNKMKELDLHGHQWELGDSAYDKIMNVRGIPHFLLYGPDGRLIQYQAPRPSSTQIHQLLDSLLHPSLAGD